MNNKQTILKALREMGNKGSAGILAKHTGLPKATVGMHLRRLYMKKKLLKHVNRANNHEYIYEIKRDFNGTFD